jgi:F-type H+-transporting ATPase subunit b
MINIDIVLLFQAVNFLLLLFLLNTLLYRPIRKVMADRAAELEAARGKTVSVDSDVRDRMAEYELKLREAKTGANEERARMIGAARSEEAAILEDARRDAASSLAEIRAAIQKEAVKEEGRLRARAEELSRVISEKVLGRSLS